VMESGTISNESCSTSSSSSDEETEE